MPEASRLEDELQNTFQNIEIKLIQGSDGTFKVTVDGKIIFDKLSMSDKNARFPMNNEISNIIKNDFAYK